MYHSVTVLSDVMVVDGVTVLLHSGTFAAKLLCCKAGAT
jgi:hypothetical protein